MGIRFRKSVKIAKGVRVNFSKSGTSLSIGGKGNSFNIGKRGVTLTQGIPGTGISHTTRLGSSSSTNKRPQLERSSSQSTEITMKMNEKGELTFYNGEQLITDQAVIRRIKNTAQFKAQKEMLEIQRQKKIDEIVKNSEVENEKFVDIYKLSAVVETLNDFNNKLNQLEPQKYIETPYELPRPTEQEIREELEAEAKENVRASIFKVKKMRKQYVEDRVEQRLEEALAVWEQDKAEYYQDLEEEKRLVEQEYQQQYEEEKQFLESLIAGDENAVWSVFDEWISASELPVEININYDWHRNADAMMLDVDLPEIEDIKQTKMIKTNAGSLKEKKKTQAELREEYARLVFGLAICISSHTFNVSPAIKRILISGYTQRRNKDGDLKDDYVYSLKFHRNDFENCDLTHVSPIDFCTVNGNRFNMTSTYLLKAITPFESIDD